MKYSLFSRYRNELMGVAILNVLTLHFLSWTDLHNPTWLVGLLHSFGLLVFTEGFLFLSGFGLYYSFKKRPVQKDFYLKRIKRLLVPYWIISLPFFILWLCQGKYDFAGFLMRVTTLQFWFHGNYTGMWYISISVFLYLLFPVFYRIINWRSWGVILLLVLSCSLLGLIYFFFEDYYLMNKIGLSKIPFFIIGIWAGKQSYNEKAFHYIWIVVLFVVWRFATAFPILEWLCFCESFHRLFGITITCLAIYGVSIVLHNKELKIIRWFGCYTLEIYILHLMIFEVLFDIMNNIYLISSLSIGIALLVCVPANKICGYISQKTGELFLQIQKR